MDDQAFIHTAWRTRGQCRRLLRQHLQLHELYACASPDCHLCSPLPAQIEHLNEPQYSAIEVGSLRTSDNYEITAIPVQPTKNWQYEMTPEFRTRVLYAFIPLVIKPEEITEWPPGVNEFVLYLRNMELEYYQNAESGVDYYHMIADMILFHMGDNERVFSEEYFASQSSAYVRMSSSEESGNTADFLSDPSDEEPMAVN